jgi:hypothetical protein
MVVGAPRQDFIHQFLMSKKKEMEFQILQLFNESSAAYMLERRFI